MKDTVHKRHKKFFATDPTAYYFSPATLQILGEGSHTLKGKVLTLALNKGLYAGVHTRDDHTLSIMLDFHDEPKQLTIDLSNLTPGADTIYERLANAIIKKLQYEGYRVQKGLNISITGSKSLPNNLGFHATFEMLLLFIFNHQNGFELSKEKQVRYAFLAERSLGELHSNIAQHHTCMYASKNHINYLDTKTLEHKALPYNHTENPAIMVFLNRPKFILNVDIADRLKAIEKGTEIIKDYRAINALSELGFDEFNKMKTHVKNPTQRQYLEHVMFEQERIEQAVEYLENKDMIMFADTLEQSQNSLKHLYEISNQYYEDILSQMYRYGTIGARICNIGYEQIIVAFFEKGEGPDSFAEFKESFYKQYKKDLDIQPVKTDHALSVLE